jgi:hypothetical protein
MGQRVVHDHVSPVGLSIRAQTMSWREPVTPARGLIADTHELLPDLLAGAPSVRKRQGPSDRGLTAA